MKRIIIFEKIDDLHQFCAQQFIDQVKKNPFSKIGFATGSTPIKTYKLLIEDYQKNGTSWVHIKGFNLDEFIGISQNHQASFRKQMMVNLYNHININKNNIYIPFSETLDPLQEAKNYEQTIEKLGPIDFQYISVGVNGHIAFNEPGTSFDSLTHMTDLTKLTIMNMVKKGSFKNVNEVPKYAITMGIKTILKSTKKVMMVSYGAHKADVTKEMIESIPNTQITATALQNHTNCFYVLDKASASKLSQTTLKVAEYR